MTRAPAKPDGRWTLDRDALLIAVNNKRNAEGKTWADVCRETGIYPSFFTRFLKGGDLSSGALATLTAWLGEPLPYTRRVTAEPPAPNMDPLF
jgi:hypothetical protein